ncbi:hypothetical protein [Catenulispora sp. MAP12-49]|uniref:TRADD-N-associated membrane domain-containing protein n=1 Tax=Catenulispora sp. MAP12-49 TaxID=3156302 RepID=UPI0035190907
MTADPDSAESPPISTTTSSPDSRDESSRKARTIRAALRIAVAIWCAYVATQTIVILTGVFVINTPLEATVYAAVLAITVFGAAYWLLRRLSEQAGDRTRHRLTEAISSDADVPQVRVYGDRATIHLHNQGQGNATDEQKTSRFVDEAIKAAIHDDAEQKLLVQMYSERLEQAKIWFWCSVGFGSLGAIILLAGIGLAVFHANTSGQRYIGIVTSAASVVPNLLALLFFRQSNLAQRMMENQAEQLREVTREKRNVIIHEGRLSLAVDLLEKISDMKLQDAQRAKLARRVSSGEQTSEVPSERSESDSPSQKTS